jgi:hypothetical protein
MENFGCIVLKEQYGHVVPGVTDNTRALRIARLVAHEVSHHWFGDGMSVDWWDDTWLKEGAARWLEFLFLDHRYARGGMLHSAFLEAAQLLFQTQDRAMARRAEGWVRDGAIDALKRMEQLAGDGEPCCCSPTAASSATSAHSSSTRDAGQVSGTDDESDDGHEAARSRRPIFIDASTPPRQIMDAFDAVTYGKAACLLRTLYDTVGADVYMSGVRRLLKARMWSSASSADFIAAVADAWRLQADRDAVAAGLPPGAVAAPFQDVETGAAVDVATFVQMHLEAIGFPRLTSRPVEPSAPASADASGTPDVGTAPARAVRWRLRTRLAGAADYATLRTLRRGVAAAATTTPPALSPSPDTERPQFCIPIVPRRWLCAPEALPHEAALPAAAKRPERALAVAHGSNVGSPQQPPHQPLIRWPIGVWMPRVAPPPDATQTRTAAHARSAWVDLPPDFMPLVTGFASWDRATAPMQPPAPPRALQPNPAASSNAAPPAGTSVYPLWPPDGVAAADASHTGVGIVGYARSVMEWYRRQRRAGRLSDISSDDPACGM